MINVNICVFQWFYVNPVKESFERKGVMTQKLRTATVDANQEKQGTPKLALCASWWGRPGGVWVGSKYTVISNPTPLPLRDKCFHTHFTRKQTINPKAKPELSQDVQCSDLHTIMLNTDLIPLSWTFITKTEIKHMFFFFVLSTLVCLKHS